MAVGCQTPRPMGKFMRKLGAVAAAAISATVAGAAPSASAATSDYQCWDQHGSNADGPWVKVMCRIDSHLRGVVYMFGGSGGSGQHEKLVVDDRYSDGHSFVGYVEKAGGTVVKKLATGSKASSAVSLPEGTTVFVYACEHEVACSDGHSITV